MGCFCYDHPFLPTVPQCESSSQGPPKTCLGAVRVHCGSLRRRIHGRRQQGHKTEAELSQIQHEELYLDKRCTVEKVDVDFFVKKMKAAHAVSGLGFLGLGACQGLKLAVVKGNTNYLSPWCTFSGPHRRTVRVFLP